MVLRSVQIPVAAASMQPDLILCLEHVTIPVTLEIAQASPIIPTYGLMIFVSTGLFLKLKTFLQSLILETEI